MKGWRPAVHRPNPFYRSPSLSLKNRYTPRSGPTSSVNVHIQTGRRTAMTRAWSCHRPVCHRYFHRPVCRRYCHRLWRRRSSAPRPQLPWICRQSMTRAAVIWWIITVRWIWVWGGVVLLTVTCRHRVPPAPLCRSRFRMSRWTSQRRP